MNRFPIRHSHYFHIIYCYHSKNKWPQRCILNVSKHQHAQQPPSTGKQCPFINEDFSVNKNMIGLLTSFNSPNRYNGILLFIACALVGSLQFGMLILVMITVGFTLLQRILRGPNSRANARVSYFTKWNKNIQFKPGCFRFNRFYDLISMRKTNTASTAALDAE